MKENWKRKLVDRMIRAFTNSPIHERTSISTRPRGLRARSLLRRTRHATFLRSSPTEWRLDLRRERQGRLRWWEDDGVNFAGEYAASLKRGSLLTWRPREETEKMMEKGTRSKRTLRACFLRGSNSTCRGHIAGHHFKEYEKRCGAATPPIELNFRCIPEGVKKVRREAMQESQRRLTFMSVTVPEEFTRRGILEAIARYIACEDQVCFGVQLF
jgi:hypothetical protein